MEFEKWVNSRLYGNCTAKYVSIILSIWDTLMSNIFEKIYFSISLSVFRSRHCDIAILISNFKCAVGTAIWKCVMWDVIHSIYVKTQLFCSIYEEIWFTICTILLLEENSIHAHGQIRNRNPVVAIRRTADFDEEIHFINRELSMCGIFMTKTDKYILFYCTDIYQKSRNLANW